MRTKKKEINIKIGKRLQTARENNGYTQEAFTEILDISVEHYRKLESGVYGLQPEKMLVLYETYKIDPTYFVTGVKDTGFDIEMFMAKCSRKERDDFIERVKQILKKIFFLSPLLTVLAAAFVKSQNRKE